MTTQEPPARSTAIRRMAQIITQKFVGQPAASASVERAIRIFEEMVMPEQRARRQAEAEAEQLRAQNIRLQDELAAAMKAAAERGVS